MRWQLGFHLLFLSIFVSADEKEEFKDLSHGFGTDVEWIEWPKAIELSKELKRPIFLLIHKTWCGACKQLKKSFETSPKRDEFIKISRKFVMVNLEDDEEPEDDKFAPDGRYIPRVYFLKGDELLAVDNKKNYPKNAYYFPQLPDIIRGMNDALKLYEKDADESGSEKVQEEKKPKEETKKTTDETKKEKKVPEEVKPKKKETKKDETKKKETKKDETKKKETKKDDTQKDEECPHAKKAKEEKAKKAKESKSDSSKSGKDNTEKKKTKENTKKSEL